jgi:hypothetical protein
MAKAAAVREAKKAERTPFSSPSADESVEILIPEGAESGQIPAGDQYIGKCLGFVQGESKGSGNPMLTWTFTMHEGDFAGMDFTFWTPLTENSMWKLADTLTALGVDWEPGVPLSISSKQVAGTLVRMNIKDDKFEGRDRSKLAGILPHPDGAGKKAKKGFTVPSNAEEDEEEEEAPRARKGKLSKAVEYEDEEEEQPVRGRKRAVVEDEDEEEEERPVRRGKAKPAEEEMEERWPTKKSAKRAAREEEDEEEEEVAPRRRARAVADEDEDEEEEPVRKPKKRSRL